MHAKARQPTLYGLLEFLNSHEFRAVLNQHGGKRSWSGIYAVRNVIRATGHPIGSIITTRLIDDIIDYFKIYACGRSYTSSTISTYGSQFRTASIMYHRWYNDDPHWNEMRTTRTISACEEHTDPVYYTETGLHTHHIKLSSGMEATLKLPQTLTRSDADRLIEFVGVLTENP